MKTFQTAISAAFLSIFATGAAQAALLDFTDSSWETGSSPMSLDVDGITVTIQGHGGSNLTFRTIDLDESDELSSDLFGYNRSTKNDGARDGIGVSNGNGDEIGENESLEISFSSPVNVTRIDFLDLFMSDGQNYESVSVSEGSDRNIYTFSQGTVNDSGYFTTNDFSYSGITSLVFQTYGNSDDLNSSQSDFSVAAVEFSAVPIPAALPLFASALAGLGFVGYRRRKA